MDRRVEDRRMEAKEARRRVLHRIVRCRTVTREERNSMSGPELEELMKKREAESLRLLEEQENKKYKEREKDFKNWKGNKKSLIKMQQLEDKKRENHLAAYFRKNPLNKELFISDIERFGSIYVCSFGYAKLESPNYKTFMESLTDDGSYRVHLGRKNSLSDIVGVFDPRPNTPNTEGWPEEMLPGLHTIGSMLFNYDDSGVILTDKTREEVLRKLKEYEECDFVKAGQIPMESLVFKKDDIVALPPGSRANPRNFFAKLRKLGMPVKLEDGKCVCVADTFPVCEVGKRVAEDDAEILKLLDKKMFKFVLVPLCFWSASTKETEYFNVDLPKCWW